MQGNNDRNIKQCQDYAISGMGMAEDMPQKFLKFTEVSSHVSHETVVPDKLIPLFLCRLHVVSLSVRCTIIEVVVYGHSQ